jgi:hypothetical protein
MPDIKTPQLQYSEDGRGGTIRYTSPETSFDLWYELAMPPALAIIGIHDVKHWEGHTKTPLAQREAILRSIGQQVVNDKLSGNGYYLIEEQTMLICRGKNTTNVI